MSEFKPCIIIPNYNHGRDFVAFVEKLFVQRLPIIVINDGSDTLTSQVLHDLERDRPEVEVLHFPDNRGKGAAVIAGLRRALERNFTHALQIDADGQHDLNDLEKFLTMSRGNPQAVICGTPLYDESVPAHRKLSRYITHFWVWVETLSFNIKDSMCGFRIYPLTSIERVLQRYSLGERMDFDTEILVKLYWEKTQIISLPTRVIYPENGLSNFRLWQDNWLISKMHTRLFFGMLLRIPDLISRSNDGNKPQHWARVTERGSHICLKFMFRVYHHLGRHVFLLILHPVVLYFSLTAGPARRASRQYLQQLAKFQGEPLNISFRKIYAHFYAFGVSAIDKIASWTGEIKRSDVIIHGQDLFNEIIASRYGAVFIGSHLGNLELCRALGEQGGRFRINAVVFQQNALKFQEVLRACAPNVAMNLIHVESIAIDTAIVLKQKIDAGEIIIIVGDRTPVSSVGRVQYVDFLGRKAPFAEGPFILSSLLECPVYLIFCIKESETYNVYLERFEQNLKLPRAGREQRLEEKVQEYANRLTYYCTKSPLQWFNFYDFWQSDGT